jgi:curved DNA-binding protein CbpA
MSANEFVDYYELLQLSPNADAETIERIFRHLAKKYHPDSQDFGDNDRFVQIVEAHQTLSDPSTRAGYDVKHQDYRNRKWRLASSAANKPLPDDDRAMRDRLLQMLYAQRRQNMKNPGLGEHQIAHLLGTPYELVEFHLWYLKAKGWVERLETGHLAITSEGVDQAEQNRLTFRPDRLIEVHDGDSGNGAE